MISVIAIALTGCGNTADSSDASVTTAAATETIFEVGCAACIYSMEGIDHCATAVKVGDTLYLLAGAELDAMSNELCESTKQAKAVGSVQDDKFVAESIALVAKSE